MAPFLGENFPNRRVEKRAVRGGTERKDAERRQQGKLRQRVVVHALLRLPRGSNKRDDIATGVLSERAGWRARGERDRSRTRAICSEIVLLQAALGREGEEERRQREDKNVLPFLRASPSSPRSNFRGM